MRRYVTVEVDTEVEVCLADIDTTDLVSEIADRFRKNNISKSLIEELRDANNSLNELFRNVASTKYQIKIENLNDLMKYEHLAKVFNKYSLDKLETLLKLVFVTFNIVELVKLRITVELVKLIRIVVLVRLLVEVMLVVF